MNQNNLKEIAAEAALQHIEKDLDTDMIIGVGTGSTVNYFIDSLAKIKTNFRGAVASSLATENLLKKYGISVFDLNEVSTLPFYIDGADEINPLMQMIKGGGGALTREKIVSSVAETFICIADQSKKVGSLGTFPVPIEVIPMARSAVARTLVKKGGNPIYRPGFVTDNNNVILDVWNLEINQPIQLENELNNIPGVVTNGLFACRPADILFLSTEKGVEKEFL